MKENDNQKNTWIPIVGGIVLIIVLFIAVKLIFAWLGGGGPTGAAESGPGAESGGDRADRNRRPSLLPVLR